MDALPSIVTVNNMVWNCGDAYSTPLTD